QGRVETMEFSENLVVESHLIAADRTPVRRIKRKDDGPRAKVAQRDGLIRRGSQREVRRPCPGWERCVQRHEFFRLLSHHLLRCVPHALRPPRTSNDRARTHVVTRLTLLVSDARRSPCP